MVPGDEAVTFGYPRARLFEQRVKDLWLSATGAVLNGGRRPRNVKCGARTFVPFVLVALSFWTPSK
jgi:hypothetical protein